MNRSTLILRLYSLGIKLSDRARKSWRDPVLCAALWARRERVLRLKRKLIEALECNGPSC